MPGFLDFLSSSASSLDQLRSFNMLASGLQGAGHLVTGLDRLQNTGPDAQAIAAFQSEQLRAQANDAMGSAQRHAWSEERRANYAASATLAAAAASGGGASDPTVINIIAQQAAEGAYRQQVAMYEGESRARQLQLQADMREREGAYESAAAKRQSRLGFAGSMMGAATTMLKAGAKDASLLSRFGGDGPATKGVDVTGIDWMGY